MKVLLELDIADMDTSRDLWVKIEDYEEDTKYFSGSAKFKPATCADCKYFQHGKIVNDDFYPPICKRTGDITSSEQICLKGEWKC